MQATPVTSLPARVISGEGPPAAVRSAVIETRTAYEQQATPAISMATTTAVATLPVPQEKAPFGSHGMRDAVLSFGSSIVIGLGSAVVVSRIYGVTVIGEFALVSAPFSMVQSFSTVGEQTALVRSLASLSPRTSRAASLFLVVLGFSSALTLVASGVTAGIAYLLLTYAAHRPELFNQTLVTLGLYAFVVNTSWNLDRLMIAFRATRAILVTRLLELSVLLAASVAFAPLLGSTSWSLVWALVVSSLAAFALRVRLAFKLVTGRPTRASMAGAWADLPDMLRFGVRTVPGAVADGISAPAGTWLIGAIRPIAVVGAYSRAYNLASRLRESGFRVCEVLLPSLSVDCHAGRFDAAAAQFSRWRLLLSTGLLGACAAVAGAGYGVLDIFGPGFSQTWIALGILLFGFSFGVLALMHEEFLFALGEPSLVSKLVLVRAGLSLALMVPLAEAYGATGTAAALAVAFGVEMLASQRRVDRRLSAEGSATSQMPWAALTTATVAAALTSRGIDLLSTWPPVTFVAVVAGLVVFVSLAVRLRLVDRAMIMRITRVLLHRV